MMKQMKSEMVITGLFGLIALFLFVTPKASFADQGTEAWTDTGAAKQEAPAGAVGESSADLVNKITALNKRVEELETKLAEKGAPASESDRMKLLEDRLSAQEKLASSGGGGGFSLDQLPSGQFLKDTKISGFIDTSYTFNFNQPANLSNNGNGIGTASAGLPAPVPLAAANLHPFDRGSNDFTLQLIELVLEKTADPIGYRVDLDFGDDAEVFGAAGLGRTDDEFDIQQAYITYKLPVDKFGTVCNWLCEIPAGIAGALGMDAGKGSSPSFDGLTGNIMAGKFVTMAGSEVIEAKDNWNFSRSFLFGSAIPFTHTGVRTNWNYKGWLDVSGGVNNGSDFADDNNQAKTIESRLGITPYDWISQGVVYIFGSERANKSGNQRHLLDLVTTIKNPFKQKELEFLNKATLMFNMDWATEQDAVRYTQGGVASVGQNDANLGAPSFIIGDSEARWHGYAGYGKYDLFPWWTMAIRGEYFQDTDGSRTLRQQDLWEITYTNQFNLFKNLITRVEYRHDGADKPIFSNTNASNQTRFRSWQDIMYLEAILTF